MTNRFAMAVKQRRRWRALYVLTFALFGGSCAILIAEWLERLRPGLANETRAGLVVLLPVALLALYEGYRRQELFAPRLWFSVLFAGGMAALAAKMVASIALKSGLAFAFSEGLYVTIAMTALCAFDFPTKPKIVLYQIGAGFLAGLLVGLALPVVTGATISPAAFTFFGMGTAACLAIAYLLVPQVFEDVAFYVIDAADEKSLAKFNNQDTGYWTMAADQRSMTIVDGTVPAAGDPSLIWIPEQLVQRVAKISRNGSEVRIEIHPDNRDSSRAGIVKINNEALTPARQHVLSNKDVIHIGSVKIAVQLFSVCLLFGLSEFAWADTGDLQWRMCNLGAKALDSAGDPGDAAFPVAEIRVPAKSVVGASLSAITIHELREGGSEVAAHRFPAHANDGVPTAAHYFAMPEGTTEGERGSPPPWLILVDVSGSMAWRPEDNRKPHGSELSRWDIAFKKLDDQTTGTKIETAILPFACWTPTPSDIAGLKFARSSRPLAAFDPMNSTSSFKDAWPVLDIAGVEIPAMLPSGKRDTRLFRAITSVLEGLGRRNRAAGQRIQFDLFTDGFNDEGSCGAADGSSADKGDMEFIPNPADPNTMIQVGHGAAPSGSTTHERISSCQALLAGLKGAEKSGDIGVRFVVFGTATDENPERSLSTCLRRAYSQADCTSSSFPQYCSSDQMTPAALGALVQRIRAPEASVSFFVRPASPLKQLSGLHFELTGDGATASVVAGPRWYGSPLGEELPPLTNRDICGRLIPDAPIPIQSEIPWFMLAIPGALGMASAVLVVRARDLKRSA